MALWPQRWIKKKTKQKNILVEWSGTLKEGAGELKLACQTGARNFGDCRSAGRSSMLMNASCLLAALKPATGL